MTLSGGEPSMQPEFALALVDAAVAERIDCALETCGSGQINSTERPRRAASSSYMI